MIELIIKAEREAERWLDQTPWYAQLLFYPEYNGAKRALRTMAGLRQQTRDDEWYGKYSLAVNDFYDNLHTATDAAFGFYEAVSAVPVIGPKVRSTVMNEWQSIAHRQFGSLGLPNAGQGAVYRLPTPPLVVNVVESTRNATIEMLASSAAEELSGPLEQYRTDFSRSYTPRNDGYWLRSAALGVAQAVGGLLEFILGVDEHSYLPT